MSRIDCSDYGTCARHALLTVRSIPEWQPSLLVVIKEPWALGRYCMLSGSKLFDWHYTTHHTPYPTRTTSVRHDIEMLPRGQRRRSSLNHDLSILLVACEQRYESGWQSIELSKGLARRHWGLAARFHQRGQ